MVLLKNDKDVLPISYPNGKKIAVIGPNAKTACYAGGGSANLAPTYLVTPLEAITTHAHKVGAKVGYTIGSDNSRWTPLLTPFIHHPTMGKDAGPGVQCDFYIQKWVAPSMPYFSIEANTIKLEARGRTRLNLSSQSITTRHSHTSSMVYRKKYLSEDMYL